MTSRAVKRGKKDLIPDIFGTVKESYTLKDIFERLIETRQLIPVLDLIYETFNNYEYKGGKSIVWSAKSLSFLQSTDIRTPLGIFVRLSAGDGEGISTLCGLKGLKENFQIMIKLLALCELDENKILPEAIRKYVIKTFWLLSDFSSVENRKAGISLLANMYKNSEFQKIKNIGNITGTFFQIFGFDRLKLVNFVAMKGEIISKRLLPGIISRMQDARVPLTMRRVGLAVCQLYNYSISGDGIPVKRSYLEEEMDHFLQLDNEGFRDIINIDSQSSIGTASDIISNLEKLVLHEQARVNDDAFWFKGDNSSYNLPWITVFIDAIKENDDEDGSDLPEERMRKRGIISGELRMKGVTLTNSEIQDLKDKELRRIQEEQQKRSCGFDPYSTEEINRLKSQRRCGDDEDNYVCYSNGTCGSESDGSGFSDFFEEKDRMDFRSQAADIRTFDFRKRDF